MTMLKVFHLPKAILIPINNQSEGFQWELKWL